MINIDPFWENTIHIDPTQGAHQGEALWLLKDLLVSAGWTVKGSGDGISAFGDGVDVLTERVGQGVANAMDNARAWMVLRSPLIKMPLPGGGTLDRYLEYGIQTIQPSYLLNPTIKLKINKFGFQQNYFDMSTADFQTMPAMDTGDPNDERVIIGGGTDAAPTGGGWYQNSSAFVSTYRCFGVAETVFPHRFWFSGMSRGYPYAAGSNFMLDALQNFNPDDHEIFMHYSTISRVNSGWDAQLIESHTSSQGACYAIMEDTDVRRINAMLRNEWGQSVLPTTYSPEYHFMAGVFGRVESLAATPKGFKGISRMLYRSTYRLKHLKVPYEYQISTPEYGPFSHWGKHYVMAWPPGYQFNHFLINWTEFQGRMFDIDWTDRERYRMSGYDTSLNKLVFWQSPTPDLSGSYYGGTGPIVNAAIHDKL